MNVTLVRMVLLILIGGLGVSSLSWTARPAAAQTNTISIEQAIQIATDYLGGGVAYEAEQEYEYGALEYEVGFTNGYKVYVDAQTGTVVWSRQKRAKRYANEMEQLPVRLIPAIQIARNNYGDGTVYEAELDDDARRWEYKVSFTDGTRVYVDAISGEVVGRDIDRDDDDDDSRRRRS